jgi:hypothetical protein
MREEKNKKIAISKFVYALEFCRTTIQVGQ